MKKILKYLLLVIVILFIGLMGFVKLMLPDVGDPEEITVELTPENIERGKYLAHSVAVCMDCHSTRDWNKFAAPIIDGTLGAGGEEFNQDIGFPGKFYSKNITPFALGEWTDGEILRAISSGVNKNGEALFPVMPHPSFGKLDRRDLYAVIAYLRTLPSIESEVPNSEPDFPMNFILNTIPKKAEYSIRPDKKDLVAYGSYIFTAASCSDCHTKQDKGAPIAGMELAGGFEFPMITGGIVRSSNITPDKETGIGSWTEEMFVEKFKSYADSSYVVKSINPGEYNTIMPWMMYATMEEYDLKAIYAFLQTQKPIKNAVTKFTAQ